MEGTGNLARLALTGGGQRHGKGKRLYQFRQFTHVGKQVLRPRGREPFALLAVAVCGIAMRAADKTESMHACGLRRLNTSDGVLNHEAIPRRMTQLLRGVEKQVWGRLAAHHQFRRKDVWSKAIVQPGDADIQSASFCSFGLP